MGIQCLSSQNTENPAYIDDYCVFEKCKSVLCRRRRVDVVESAGSLTRMRVSVGVTGCKASSCLSLPRPSAQLGGVLIFQRGDAVPSLHQPLRRRACFDQSLLQLGRDLTQRGGVVRAVEGAEGERELVDSGVCEGEERGGEGGEEVLKGGVGVGRAVRAECLQALQLRLEADEGVEWLSPLKERRSEKQEVLVVCLRCPM